MLKKILVIGGGPAGMMAAIQAAECGADVVLIEKNPGFGKKLLLTGKGRCNLTNAGTLDDFLRAFGRNGAFLRDAFKLFFNRELMTFFERRGLAMTVERQNRVFPSENRSSSIVQVLKAELQKKRVQVLLNTRVTRLRKSEDRVIGVALSDGRELESDAVVLATGGLSYAFTGSTGDGLKFATELGHELIACRPGLVALVIEEKFVKELEGLTLKNIRITFRNSKRKVVSEIGELLFTGTGISGPLVLSLSRTIVDWFAEGNVTVSIDLKPALSLEQLDRRFVTQFESQPRKCVKNILRDFLPVSFIDVFLRSVQIPAEKTASHLLQAERQRMGEALKNFQLHVLRPLPLEEAMVTKGGVSLKDIDPRTMRSRRIRGLYFAGEIIDIDGDTGGYNLQAAFSTGYLAGQSAAQVSAAVRD